LSYPNIAIADLAKIWPRFGELAPKIAEQIEIDAKYDVYLSRQAADVASYRARRKFPRCRMISITQNCRVCRTKPNKNCKTHRPRTIGHASKIDGMTPAALTLLVAHVKRGRKRA